MVSVRERLLDFYTLQQKLRYIGVLDNPQSRTKNDKGQGYCILVVLKYLLNYNRKFDNPPHSVSKNKQKLCVVCVFVMVITLFHAEFYIVGWLGMLLLVLSSNVWMPDQKRKKKE